MSEPLMWAAVFYAGTFIGSFYCTLAVRLSGGAAGPGFRPLFITPSSCPSCGGKIRITDLVPLIGYIVQKGKCRNCGAAIPLLYPLSEALFGALLAATLWALGATVSSISAYLVMGAGIAVSFVDVKTMKIPMVSVAMILLLAAGPAGMAEGFAETAGGFALMFLFFGIILLLFPGSFGGGDLWYASALGLVFGLELSVVLLEASLVSGALFGTGYALATKKGFRTRIPFAPFLTLGMIVTYFFGRRILFVYYDIFF